MQGAIRVLDGLGYEYEILVADDGSTDGTRERAALVGIFMDSDGEIEPSGLQLCLMGSSTRNGAPSLPLA